METLPFGCAIHVATGSSVLWIDTLTLWISCNEAAANKTNGNAETTNYSRYACEQGAGVTELNATAWPPRTPGQSSGLAETFVQCT
jgi:hypothetical protein